MDEETRTQELDEDQLEQVAGGKGSGKHSSVTIHVTAVVTSTSTNRHSNTNTATSFSITSAIGGNATASVAPIIITL